MARPSDPARRAFLAGAVALAAVPAGAHASPSRTTRLVDTLAGRLRLDIAIPDAPVPDEGFPLLVVLDGDAWFGVAASLVEARPEELGPVVVAGIGYPGKDRFNPRRLNDLTPWPPQTPLDGPQAGAPVGGGGAFAEAVLGRLLPEIEGMVRIAPDKRALFGHSLGGLLVLHLLFTRPGPFTTYVAASPSIWWDKARLMGEADAMRIPAPSPRILLTCGGLEDELSAADIAYFRTTFASDPKAYGGRTLDQVIAETRAKLLGYRMPGNARDMAERLRRRGLAAAFVQFDGETHNSSTPAALNRALSFAFAK